MKKIKISVGASAPARPHVRPPMRGTTRGYNNSLQPSPTFSPATLPPTSTTPPTTLPLTFPSPLAPPPTCFLINDAQHHTSSLQTRHHILWFNFISHAYRNYGRVSDHYTTRLSNI